MKTLSSSSPVCIDPSGPAAFVFATFNSNIECVFLLQVNSPERKDAVSVHWSGDRAQGYAPGSPTTHWCIRASKGCASMKGFREALAHMFEFIIISTELFAA